jgi:hypothetical protein
VKPPRIGTGVDAAGYRVQVDERWCPTLRRGEEWMRCDLAPVRLAATQYAVASAIVLTAATRAVAEPAACYTIQPGDTAALISLRLTGTIQQRREPWFQIIDASRSRIVTKSEYRRIRPGWLACIPASRLSLEWRRGRPPTIVDGVAATSGRLRTFATGDPAVAWWGVVVLAVMVLALAARQYVNRRHVIVSIMRQFGDRFIREFERPLIQPGCGERPVEFRLRIMPRRRRLEILLAPAGRRRYPNLSDHRRNVTYDVERVLRLLRDERFAGDHLSAHGRWVVVACRFRVGSEQEGAK